MKNNIKVLSVLPVLGQPRHSKRISMLQGSGFDVEVVAFERDYHKGRLPDCNIKSLGKISHSKYLQRVFKLIKAFQILRNAIKNNDIIYASGPDMAYLTLLAGIGFRKPIVLEVGDIREIQIVKGFVGNFVRIVDKYLVQKCSLLVSTTPAFINEYYKKWLNVKIPSIVLENKLEKNCYKKVFKNKTNKIRIGYFGLLRCNWSWEVLKNLAILNPDNIEIILAGYPINPKGIPEKANAINNIRYLGEYKSPDDLSRLYGQVDLIWAVYPGPEVVEKNQRWAQMVCRSNRFYESCYFQTPLISLKNSGDGIEVKKYNIGLIIDNQNINDVISKIEQISIKDLNYWKINMENVPQDVFVYTTEIEELKKSILQIIGKLDC